MKEALAHFTTNYENTFKVWIDSNQKLQPSHDLLQPLIGPFVEANPGVNIYSCQECIIDMLVWYRKEVKEEVTTPKTKK